MTVSLFKYMQYDDIAMTAQNKLRNKCKHIEQEILTDIDNNKANILLEDFYLEVFQTASVGPYRDAAYNALNDCRSFVDSKKIDLALFKLEEAYYWIGKYIRIDLISRLDTEQLKDLTV